jgi:hypothetical protein
MFVVGLDLGQAQDPSALAINHAEKRAPGTGTGSALHAHAIAHLHRWPLGTSYVALVDDLRALFARPPLAPGAKPAEKPVLVVDQTGVGRAVMDMIRAAGLPARVHGITITAGSVVTDKPGGWNVPKKDLVAVLQAALQQRRMAIAAGLPLAATLMKELANFKAKISTSGAETYEAWRARDHDDICLAVAMALWFAERKSFNLFF